MSQSMAPPPVQHDYYLIVPHRTEPRVLLLPSAAGWSLPHFRSEHSNLFASVAVRAAMHATLGLDTPIRRYLYTYIDPSSLQWHWTLMGLETPGAAWAPPAGARWADGAMLADLPAAHPEHLPFLADWLAEARGATPAGGRPPWVAAGWLDGVLLWLAEQLGSRGQPLTGPVEQVKTWNGAYLLRGPTVAGAVYFKAANPLLSSRNEPAITAALAARYPAVVPQPLAVDPARGWMLLPDFGGVLLEDAPPAAWDGVIREFAALQQAAAGQVEALLAAGCPDHRLATLARCIDPFLEATARSGRLSAEELAGLHALAPRLHEWCSELASYNIPETLIHGDLNIRNIIIRGGAPLFFDWADAGIAHPFFDLGLLDPNGSRMEDADRTRLRGLYLAQWTAYGSPTRLAGAAARAARLSLLVKAMGLQQMLSVVNPADHWQYRVDWTYHARQLLADTAAP